MAAIAAVAEARHCWQYLAARIVSEQGPHHRVEVTSDVDVGYLAALTAVHRVAARERLVATVTAHGSESDVDAAARALGSPLGHFASAAAALIAPGVAASLAHVLSVALVYDGRIVGALVASDAAALHLLADGACRILARRTHDSRDAVVNSLYVLAQCMEGLAQYNCHTRLYMKAFTPFLPLVLLSGRTVVGGAFPELRSFIGALDSAAQYAIGAVARLGGAGGAASAAIVHPRRALPAAARAAAVRKWPIVPVAPATAPRTAHCKHCFRGFPSAAEAQHHAVRACESNAARVPYLTSAPGDTRDVRNLAGDPKPAPIAAGGAAACASARAAPVLPAAAVSRSAEGVGSRSASSAPPAQSRPAPPPSSTAAAGGGMRGAGALPNRAALPGAASAAVFAGGFRVIANRPAAQSSAAPPLATSSSAGSAGGAAASAASSVGGMRGLSAVLNRAAPPSAASAALGSGMRAAAVALPAAPKSGAPPLATSTVAGSAAAAAPRAAPPPGTESAAERAARFPDVAFGGESSSAGAKTAPQITARFLASLARLSPRQRAAYDVVAHGRNAWVYAGAGMGKSAGAVLAVDHFAMTYGPESVLSIASTHSARLAASSSYRAAVTLSSVLGFDVSAHAEIDAAFKWDNAKNDYADTKARAAARKLRPVRLLHLDEIFMMSAQELELLEYVFRLAKSRGDPADRASNRPNLDKDGAAQPLGRDPNCMFGGVQLLLTGDPSQLLPNKDDAGVRAPSSELLITRSRVFQRVCPADTWHSVDGVVRRLRNATEEEAAAATQLWQRVRVAWHTLADVRALRNEWGRRLVRLDGSIELSADLLLITGKHEKRIAYNNARLYELCVAGKLSPVVLPGPPGKNALLYVVPGARVVPERVPIVVAEHGADPSYALYPGARGTVVRINRDLTGTKKISLDVLFDGYYNPVRVTHQKLFITEQLYMPLALGFALTITTSQSQGFSRILINVTDCGWLDNGGYTAISRAAEIPYALLVMESKTHKPFTDSGGFVWGARLELKPACQWDAAEAEAAIFRMFKVDELSRRTLLGCLAQTDPKLQAFLLAARADFCALMGTSLEPIDVDGFAASGSKVRPAEYCTIEQLHAARRECYAREAAVYAAYLRDPAAHARILAQHAIDETETDV